LEFTLQRIMQEADLPESLPSPPVPPATIRTPFSGTGLHVLSLALVALFGQ